MLTPLQPHIAQEPPGLNRI